MRRVKNANYIATPPSRHKEYALASLNAGKDIYLEKPMALNAHESFEFSNPENVQLPLIDKVEAKTRARDRTD